MTPTTDRSRLEIAELMRDVRTRLHHIAADAVELLASAGKAEGIDTGLLGRVDHSIMYLEQAIEHLVKVDAMQTAVDPMPFPVVDLDEVVASAVRANEERHRIDHVRGKPLMVRADAKQLQFAIGGLIDTALETARSHSIIVVRTTRDGLGAQVAVVTLGRSDESGLALRVARRTAELHGGTATLREMIGLTRWTLDLPAVQSGVSVLLVDDNVEQVVALAELLRKDGLVIDYATSGGQALARFADRMPDVLVVDIQIPDIDGVEVIRQARERRPNLPVAVLTGYPPDHPTIKGATADGRSTYVAKPVDIEALIEFVTAHSR